MLSQVITRCFERFIYETFIAELFIVILTFVGVATLERILLSVPNVPMFSVTNAPKSWMK
jgi:hypothetical protein